MLIETTKKTLREYTNINNPVVLAPTPDIKYYFLSQAKQVFRKSTPDHVETKHLFNICDVVVTEEYTLHSPCIGAPVITFILEPLLQLGVKNIILFSICGGIRSDLTSNLKIGDFILPTGALCDEGTSPHYGAGEDIAYSWKISQQSLAAKVKTLTTAESSICASSGKIWTTDAIYKETTERVLDYSKKGAIGVDMEMSAVLHLCNLYGASLCSLFVVSDLTGTDFQVGLNRDTFHNSMNKAAKLLAETVHDL